MMICYLPLFVMILFVACIFFAERKLRSKLKAMERRQQLVPRLRNAVHANPVRYPRLFSYSDLPNEVKERLYRQIRAEERNCYDEA